jgi:hypothetical protein
VKLEYVGHVGFQELRKTCGGQNFQMGNQYKAEVEYNSGVANVLWHCNQRQFSLHSTKTALWATYFHNLLTDMLHAHKAQNCGAEKRPQVLRASININRILFRL